MPVVKPKPPPPSHHTLHVGSAVGRADDFWALAYCPELDEIEKDSDPEHTEFTYILHYVGREKLVEARYRGRLDAIWQRSDGVLLAAGENPSVLEFETDRMREIPLAVPGIFSSIWGANDENIFCGGTVVPFAMVQHRGQWHDIALPDGTEDIREIRGFSEKDVYFVGGHGMVLHFDGRSVTRLRVPTPRILTGIAALDATRMCVSGYQGTLLVGNAGGWRPLITNTSDPLLTVAALDGKAYYGVESSVWSTDGVAPPEPEYDFPARWVSALTDGLVFSHGEAAMLCKDGVLTELSVSL